MYYLLLIIRYYTNIVVVNVILLLVTRYYTNISS